MREGVPQGCVISPTFFLQHYNYSPETCRTPYMQNGIAVWSAADHTTSAAYRIEEAVRRIHQWIDEWSLQISKIKTQATIFSLATLKEKITLKLGDRTLPQVETPIFLGVKLDPRLSRKQQIDEMATKGIRKLALLKKHRNTLGS